MLANVRRNKAASDKAALWRITAFGVAALVFSLLVIAVRVRWVPLESVDRGVADGLNELIAPNRFLVQLMGGISRLGSFGVLFWLVAIGATLLVVRRQYRLAGFLVAAALGGVVLDPTLKAAIGRLRPVVEQPVAHGGGNSFPSGHSLNSFICYSALLLVFLPALRRRWRRPVLIAFAVLVALIGFSRLALGVHFLSDVIGAWSLGFAWVGLCAAAFQLMRYQQGRRVTAPLDEGLEPEAAPDLRPTDPQGADAAGAAATADERGADAADARTRSASVAAGTRSASVARGADAQAHSGPIGAATTPNGRLWAVAGLAVAWVLTFGALVALGLPLAKYRKGNGNVLWDTTVPHWFAAHRTDLLGRVSIIGSEVGNTHAILAIGLVVGAVALAALRRWTPVVFLLTVMFGELTLFLASAAIVGRVRPDVANMDGKMPTSSFPSGHVAATICIWTAAALLVLPRTRAWWRWLFVAAAVVMPAWVAVSRMYRGMHHPTDILGSCVLAGLWLAATWWLLRPDQDRTAPPAASAPAPASARKATEKAAAR